jgi:hypothetical protein
MTTNNQLSILLAVYFCLSIATGESQAQQPRHVTIQGYTGDVMEPFITRNGRYLLFNNLNQPITHTFIQYAKRVDDYTWIYQGKVRGIDSPALEGCPTMDSSGKLYFVAPEHYAKTLCTICCGQFKGGDVTDVRIVDSISLKQPGMVNFDVDVSADGEMLVFVDSKFIPGAGPKWSKLIVANWNGTQFERSNDSDRLMKLVNVGMLQYAPTISKDKLTLYFTRFDPNSRYPAPQIFCAKRTSVDVPFGNPMHVDGLGAYVEGSALSPNEKLLYFHRKNGNEFNVYAAAVPVDLKRSVPVL